MCIRTLIGGVLLGQGLALLAISIGQYLKGHKQSAGVARMVLKRWGL